MGSTRKRRKEARKTVPPKSSREFRLDPEEIWVVILLSSIVVTRLERSSGNGN